MTDTSENMKKKKMRKAIKTYRLLHSSCAENFIAPISKILLKCSQTDGAADWEKLCEYLKNTEKPYFQNNHRLQHQHGAV